MRNHGAVPEATGEWRLRVHGAVERQLDLSLATLREALPEHTVTATLQCAGNRRAGLIAIRDIPGEAPWGPGATGTASGPGARWRTSSRSPGRCGPPRTSGSRAPT